MKVRVLFLTVLLSAAAAPIPAQGWLAAIGGGTEFDEAGAWSEVPYRWVVDRAGGGTVAVLSAGRESRWIPDYFELLGARDAFNLQIADLETADSAETAEVILAADAVFIKGGDQWRYVRSWKGTRTEDAIRAVYSRGGVVAGTSAGAHILSEVVFDARNGTIYPEEAVRDPFDHYLSLSEDFLGLLPDALVDSHFTRRGRIGRLLPMLARWYHDTGRHLLGIGIDERTALLVNPDLRAEVAGEGAVTFLRATPATRVEIAEGAPPVITAVACDQLTEGFVFDLLARTVAAVPEGAITRWPEPFRGEVVATELVGTDETAAAAGLVRIEDPGADPYALQLGMLEEAPGRGELGRLIVMPRAFSDRDEYENRVGGAQWLLARNPGAAAVLLDAGAQVSVTGSGRLRPVPGRAEPSVLVLDGRNLAAVEFSNWWTYEDSVGPRQSVALAGLEVHLIASGLVYSELPGRVAGVAPRPAGDRQRPVTE